MFVSGLTMMAQPQQRGKFNPEMYKAKLESYITGEAGFTPAEAQAFYPIYHEMKDKQRQLQRRIFWLKKNPPAHHHPEDNGLERRDGPTGGQLLQEDVQRSITAQSLYSNASRRQVPQEYAGGFWTQQTTPKWAKTKLRMN